MSRTSRTLSDKKNNNSLKALPGADSSRIENKIAVIENQSDMEQLLQSLAEEIPDRSNQIEQLKQWQQNLEGVFDFQRRNSKIAIAIIEPGTFSIRYLNQAFDRLANASSSKQNKADENIVGIRLHELFKDWDGEAIEQLYRRHILSRVLQQQYNFEAEHLQILDDSTIVRVKNALDGEQRYLEFWLNSENLKVTRIDQKLDEFADLKIKLMSASEREVWSSQLQELENLARQLRLDNYHIEGLLLLEGLDVTDREKRDRLAQLLVDRDSMMIPEKFEQIHNGLRSLFGATDTIFLRHEGQEVHLFIGSEYLTKTDKPIVYSKSSVEDSTLMAAASANRVWYIPELRRESKTECEQYLKQIGVRSLLLIPLVVNASNLSNGNGKPQLLGMTGLTSDRPGNFSAVDRKNAQALTPALIAAVRQTIQQRFTKIRSTHPAVEWRFVQEAERRSLGLPPETIVFDKVYPLYGISDIRGSSTERNRAIQTDLMEQFKLALAVVDAVCQGNETALGERLREDFLEYIEQLKEKVTVEIEVTAVEYLREHFEIYFEFFSRCGEKAKAAVEAYKAAGDNEHGSVYKARDRYDNMLRTINDRLQATWESWQKRMQKVIPHHCDFEASDGIDHMIYAGKSINSQFTLFHLRSLRYDQLRAICDCARTGLRLEDKSESMLKVAHLVLVQNTTIDIYHNESTEKLFDVKGTRDIRYEIVKKRIDKAIDKATKGRITQTGMLTVVYSTEDEWEEYRQYLRYLAREGWVEDKIEMGMVEPLQGVSGLRFARVKVLRAVEPESAIVRQGEVIENN